MIKSLVYWYHRRFDDLPCRAEMAEVLANMEPKHNRNQSIVYRYAKLGQDVDLIAKYYRCTRGRVRGNIWAAWYNRCTK